MAVDLKSALDAFASYQALVDAYVAAAEQHKADVAQAVTDAIAKDDAGEEVDLQALKDAMTAAAAKVPPAPAAPPAFTPSGNG